MFKENQEFWLYIVGIIILFFILFFAMRSYFGGNVDVGSIFTIGETNDNQIVTTDGDSGGVEIVFEDQPEVVIEEDEDYYAIITTNLGEFKVELYEDNAPNTVNNFIALSNEGYYDGTSFHRMIPDVLLQGGSRNTLNDDPNDDRFGGPGYVFDDEINWDSLDFDKKLRDQLIEEGYTSATKIASRDIAQYSLAMANAGPNTNGSQFFIVLGDPESDEVKALRGRHTVFGEVSENIDLIDEFNSIEVTSPNSNQARPEEDIIVEKIEVFVK